MKYEEDYPVTILMREKFVERVSNDPGYTVHMNDLVWSTHAIDIPSPGDGKPKISHILRVDVESGEYGKEGWKRFHASGTVDGEAVDGAFDWAKKFRDDDFYQRYMYPMQLVVLRELLGDELGVKRAGELRDERKDFHRSHLLP